VPREEFELKVPMFERSKATEALDLVSSGIGFPLSDTICLRNHTINWPFTCIILTVTDFDYVKFIRHNLKVSHSRHVCNSQHMKNVSYRICRYVYGLHAKCHMPSSSDCLVTATKREANCEFLQPPYYYLASHKKYQNHILRDASVAPTSEIHATAILVLLKARNLKVQRSWPLTSI
jgi:hypothetical protein